MKILHLHRSVLWIIALLVVAVVAWAISHVNAGHKEWVSAVAFSADGNMLVSAAGNDRTAEVIAWDVKASTVRNRQTLESGRPRWLWCFDSDHAFLGYSVAGKSITDYKPDAVTLLNLADMTVENQFSEPAVAGGTLPLPASKKLVVFGWRSIQLKNLENGSDITLFRDPDSKLTQVRASRKEHFLAATDAGRVHLWDMNLTAEAAQVDSLSQNTEPVGLGEVAVTDDGNFVAASRYEYDYDVSSFPLLFWDRSQGLSPVKKIDFPRAVTDLRFLPGDAPRLLAVSGKEHAECEVSLYDATGNLLQNLYRGNASVDGVDVTPDGKRLVWVNSQHQGEMWDVSGAEAKQLWKQSLIEVDFITFSPDSKLIAGHGYSRDVWLFDAETGKVASRLEGYQPSEVAFYALSILPIFLLTAAVQWFRERSAKNREDGIAVVADRLGWQHTSGALPYDISEFDFFKRRGGGSFEHVLLGHGDEFKTLLAVYSWTERSNNGDVPMQDLCVIYPHVAKNLPDLFIRPEFLTDRLAEYIGFTDVDLDGTETLRKFSRLYLLRTKDSDQMERTINEPLAKFLCENEGWNIEVLDGSVLMRWQRVKSFTSGRFSISESSGIEAFIIESRTIIKLLIGSDQNT